MTNPLLPIPLGQHFDANGENPVAYVGPLTERGGGINISFNNNWSKRNGVYTFGFVFCVTKEEIRYVSSKASARSYYYPWKRYFTGNFRIAPGNLPVNYTGYLHDGHFYNDYQGQTQSAWQYGSEAWQRLRPDLPDFDAAQELAELKDLPGLFKPAVKDIVDKVREVRRQRSRRR